MNDAHQFTKWFVRATGKEPYPFQIRFACGPELPQLVDVPTGMGKTAMAVLGWLW
jgi:CRISPR-associated endonuclease/helicase Cas3